MRAESPTVERNGKIDGKDIMGWKGWWLLAIRNYVQVYVGVAELHARSFSIVYAPGNFTSGSCG